MTDILLPVLPLLSVLPVGLVDLGSETRLLTGKKTQNQNP